MEAVAGRDMTVLRDARKSSLMTQRDMAKHLGRSTATIVEWEKRPDQVPITVLRDYYKACGTDARVWIKEFVDSFFID